MLETQVSWRISLLFEMQKCSNEHNDMKKLNRKIKLAVVEYSENCGVYSIWIGLVSNAYSMKM